MADNEVFKDKKYNDKVFDRIQSRHITLNDGHMKRNNKNLQKVWILCLKKNKKYL